MRIRLESIINIIRENLHDRYRSGFPILRELIQNADDAGATRFDFGLSPGLKASHPLLKGPSLFVVNDGGFTASDAEAIDSVAFSHKAGDGATIGKFGLGLKSVFHLCEAFFFFDSRHPHLRLVNPWQDGEKDEIHPEWNNITDEDMNLVLDHLADVLPTERFFGLWIPLRQKTHLPKNAPIIEFYPGDDQRTVDELFSTGNDGNGSLYLETALLIPMLQSMQLIQHWFSNGSGFDTTPNRINLQKDCIRRRPLSQLEPGKLLSLEGVLRIAYSGSNGSTDIRFSGHELQSDADAFSKIQSSSQWPKHTVTEPETYKRKIVDDKAVPHAAVCFVRHPNRNASSALRITRSVFLPVDGYEPSDLEGFTEDIHLILHGYFFVDAGRSRIEGTEESSPVSDIQDSHTLRTIWNAHLFQQGTLPMILPALSKFVEQAKLSDIMIEELTRALAKHDIFKNGQFRSAICRDCQWVYHVEHNNACWRLLPADSKVYAIPQPPGSDLTRPFSVLPKLAEITTLTYRSTPRLSVNSGHSNWETEALLSVLEVDVDEVFGSGTKLAYLVAFLNDCVSLTDQNDTVAQRLLELGRQAMATHGPAVLRENRLLFSSFCKFIPSKHRLALPLAQQHIAASDAFFMQLAAIRISMLIVPKEFDDRVIACSRISRYRRRTAPFDCCRGLRTRQ